MDHRSLEIAAHCSCHRRGTPLTGYLCFKIGGSLSHPATVATPATVHAESARAAQSVATVASVARGRNAKSLSEPETVATVAGGEGQTRELGTAPARLPEPSPALES